MTRVRAEDLPAKVRKQLGLDQPRQGKAKKGGGSVAIVGWCQCGEWFGTAASWTRHSDATGHRRLQCWPDPNAGSVQ